MKNIVFLLILVITNKLFANEYISHEEIDWFPTSLEKVLTEKRCRIPKNIVWENVAEKIPVTGVLVGQFAKQGQYDLAVLCNNKNSSHIVVHWGGPNRCASTINSWGEHIGLVSKDFILEHFNEYGGREPPKIEHGGINDVLIGKGSVVYYCHETKWLKLTGAD